MDRVAQINNQATYYCQDFFAKLNQDFDNFYLAIKYLAESREESTFPNFQGMLDNGMLGWNVPEFFNQYGYGSQFIELIDLCIGRIHTINNENDDSLFIYQIKLLFQKNRSLIGLNRLREAEDLLNGT